MIFFSSSARFKGVKFDGYAVGQARWGLRRGACPFRLTVSSRDAGSFKSGLHLFAWRQAPWPVRPVGAQTQMRLAYVIKCLLFIAA